MRFALTLGTTDNATLRDALRERGVCTNAYFDALWRHVVVADPPRALEVVITTPAQLGLPDGATLDALLAHVGPLGLGPCPLEAAARLRLALTEPPGPGASPWSRHDRPRTKKRHAASTCAPTSTARGCAPTSRRTTGALIQRSGLRSLWWPDARSRAARIRVPARRSSRRRSDLRARTSRAATIRVEWAR